MQRVLEKYKYGAPSGVYLPALLRYDFFGLAKKSTLTIASCTVRLLIHEMEGNKAQSNENITAICKVFEGGKSCT